MFARCSKLNLTPNQVPVTLNDLKDKVQHIIDANSPAAQTANSYQQAQPAPSVQQSQTVPPRKGGGKRQMDSEGFTIPPKHLIWRESTTSTSQQDFPRTQPQPSTRVTTELSYAQIVNNKPAAQQRTVSLPTPPRWEWLAVNPQYYQILLSNCSKFFQNSRTTTRFISPLSSGQ
ncbi:hypothetical protein CDAR_64781 [Caerostris darwini]|uniref:Uncharacterized protein n=1 Tax=Caerostris darwini TaxID=1538125 RepID=A0AAV4N8K6_9ARAC|nr:hypothetical protein CDAR_64781 [Caerostris darwini]